MNDNETAKALRAIAEWHRKQGHLGFMNFCLAGASKIEELNDFQNSQCAKLLEKLNAAERRERAAVENYNVLVGLIAERLSAGSFEKLCELADELEVFVTDWRGP